MADDDCIFCRIVSGELPAAKVDEDEHTVAFMDLNPWTRGHALIVPRTHSRDLFEISDEDHHHVGVAVRRLAAKMRERLGCDGVNVLNSAGEAAWQTVFHFHVHVIPRYDDDPLELPTRPKEADREELERLADELRG